MSWKMDFNVYHLREDPNLPTLVAIYSMNIRMLHIFAKGLSV